jgi:hypothetical protein
LPAFGEQSRLLASPSVTQREQSKGEKQEWEEDHMPRSDHEHDHGDSEPYRK